MPAFRCLHCGALLHPERTRRAVYCADRCRAAMAHLVERYFEPLSPTLERLFHLLREHAPDQAIGYQLVLLNRDTVYRYPPSRRRWIAYNGRPSYRAAFRLYPYEIPIVPLSALYGLQLVTRFAVLPLPLALSHPVPLDPIRPFAVEEGEVIR